MLEQSKVRLISEARQRKIEEADQDKENTIKRTAFSQEEINNYEEGISQGQKVFWPLLFACAIATDCADAIPVAGTAIKLIALPIIWYNLYIKMRAHGYLDDKYKIQISWRVRLLFRALGVVDIIPLISSLPLTTLSVFIVWYKVQKQIRDKKGELVEAEQQQHTVLGSQNQERYDMAA